MRVLPIQDSIRETYRSVFGNPILLFKALVFPYSLITLIWLVWDSVPGSAAPYTFFVAQLISLVPYAFFGVTWHRFVLLGKTRGRPSLIPNLGRRHLLFLAPSLIFVLVQSGPTISTEGHSISSEIESDLQIWMEMVAVTIIIFGIYYVGLPYLILRLSFVLPAIAVDESYGLGHSWGHTRRQGLRIYLLVVSVVLPMKFMLWGFAFGLERGFPAETGTGGLIDAGGDRGYLGLFLWDFAYPLLEFLPVALFISAISIGFRTCTGWVPVADSGPVTRSDS